MSSAPERPTQVARSLDLNDAASASSAESRRITLLEAEVDSLRGVVVSQGQTIAKLESEKNEYAIELRSKLDRLTSLVLAGSTSRAVPTLLLSSEMPNHIINFTSFSLPSSPPPLLFSYRVFLTLLFFLGEFGYLFESFFRTLNVSETKKRQNLEARKESLESRRRLRLQDIYDDLKPSYFFWIVKCLHKVSNKNTLLIFQIQLTLKKYGLSNTGLDFLKFLGELSTRRTFSNIRKQQLIRYGSFVFSIAFMCLFWIDNFAKFLKHFKLDKEHGSAHSNQFTAIALKRIALLASSAEPPQGWPDSPCNENVSKSIVGKFSSLWNGLKSKGFDLYTSSFLHDYEKLQVPLKAKVSPITFIISFELINL